MQISAEVRWFWGGPWPSDFREQFCAAGRYSAGGEKKRVDDYFCDTEQSELGIKADLASDLEDLPLSAGPFGGEIELWGKWRRARQNVIHEAGLFQGRLGFRRAVLLKQDGLEDFTNVHGLQYIGFSGDRIDQTFFELGRVLKRERLLGK
jgi:hypothetical protein